jgi:tryptophanyl-tRNA synthetase
MFLYHRMRYLQNWLESIIINLFSKSFDFFSSPSFYSYLGRFGSSKISSKLIVRIEAFIKEPVHDFIQRGIFFSHIFVSIKCYFHHHLNYSFLEILKWFSRRTSRKTFFSLYTDRGRLSEAMHLGHLIPFMITK